MSDVAIQVENLSKHYRLGAIGGATLREDTQRWWAKLRRRPDPFALLDGKDQSAREDHWALRDVSFKVRQGEVLGIIGRNGAGKSTLLKILSRTTAPTKGKAMVKGRIGSLLEVGTGFHPELSGRENIYLNGSILGMRKNEIDSKLEEIIDFSGVERFIDTPVKRYSSGMYVRLAFAVAAHLEPEILIVDEVLAVGDLHFQQKCLGKMQEVGSGGRTVIFVSHNMAAITQLCRTALLFREGRLVARTTPADAVKSYIEAQAGRGAKKIWLEPPGNGLKISSVEVCGAEGKPIDSIDLGKSICIKFHYVVERRVDGVRLGFRLSAQDGAVVLTSEDMDWLPVLEARDIGTFVAMVTIPGNLLNLGRYFVSVAAHVPKTEILFDENDVISFDVMNLTGERGYVDDGRRGLIRPQLEWTTVRSA